MSKDSSARDYQKIKEGLKKAREMYQDRFEEEKSKKRKYGLERRKNRPEFEKTKCSRV